MCLSNTKKIGDTGEYTATNYCIQNLGYQILNRNYKCEKFGEIDIVCKYQNFIIFVEVKTRSNAQYMPIYNVVDTRKMQALKRAAQYYILKFKLQNLQHRIDLLTINNQTGEIEYFENITTPS